MAKAKDPIRLAKAMLDEFLVKHDPDSVPKNTLKAKDPMAQTAGRLGGLKGDVVRASKLSPQKRTDRQESCGCKRE